MADQNIIATLFGSVRGRIFLAALIAFFATPSTDAVALIVIMVPIFVMMELVAVVYRRWTKCEPPKPEPGR